MDNIEPGARIVEFGQITEWIGQAYRYKGGHVQVCKYSDGTRHWGFSAGQYWQIIPFKTALTLAGIVYLGTKPGIRCATKTPDAFMGKAVEYFIRLSCDLGVYEAYETKAKLEKSGMKFRKIG